MNTQHTPRSDLVPGVMRCAKCEFQLQRVNLYVQSGTAGAGDSNTEPCPNGCGPLWPVTWKQWAEQLQEAAERLAVERAEFRIQRDELLEVMKLALDCITNAKAPLSAAAILRKPSPKRRSCSNDC